GGVCSRAVVCMSCPAVRSLGARAVFLAFGRFVCLLCVRCVTQCVCVCAEVCVQGIMLEGFEQQAVADVPPCSSPQAPRRLAEPSKEAFGCVDCRNVCQVVAGFCASVCVCVCEGVCAVLGGGGGGGQSE